MSETVENHAERLADTRTSASPELLHQETASQKALNPEVPGFEKALSEMIEKEVARRFQSAKDKRWAALEKLYGDLHKLSEQAQTGATPPPEDAAPEEETGPDFEAHIAALADLPGIRGNEDAIALILRNQHPANLDDYSALMEDLLHTVMGDAGSPAGQAANSAASVIIPGGGEASQDLEQSYQRRKKMLRPGDVSALTALKREFRQKGLDVF